MSLPHFKGNLFLAPMAGVNDLAFRRLCMDYGAGLSMTEMVSINALVRKNAAMLRLAQTIPEEMPVGIQLFGTRVDYVKKSVKILENDYPESIGPSLFDFNFGCPASNIMGQGAGSALLKRPTKMGEIIQAMRQSTDLPISAKIRLGLNQTQANYIKTAQIIEKNGADMITVHGRYQSQGYSGKADWNAIKAIQEAVSIPVVGNGDVLDEKSAAQFFETTLCKYAMIGRAAMGNPFIFTRINQYLKTGSFIPQKNKLELYEGYRKYAELYQVSFAKIKDQTLYFTRGLPHATQLRNALTKVRSLEDIDNCINEYKSNNNSM